jgi:dTDP-4-amino-4,6-dideoxy-D-galactose acyltransferase
MNSPDCGFEVLQWDSAVFGFPVARIVGTGNQNALDGALENARQAGVRLAYLSAESDELARMARSLNGTLVSERLTFARALTSDSGLFFADSANASPVERWEGTTPTAELLHLARDAGRYSRFKVDPRVPSGVFEQIYDAWITNSLNKQIADEVMVIRDGSSLTGLVTVGSKDGRADIGLLAVREEARGRGLGKALVQASLKWAAQAHFRLAQVVTQGANHPARHLYVSCGYTVERVENVFHFWL